MTLLMRQHAMLAVALVAAVAAWSADTRAHADGLTVQVSQPTDEVRAESTASYPRELESSTRRTSFSMLQPGEDTLIPPPIAEMPSDEPSGEEDPRVESAPIPNSSHSAPKYDAPRRRNRRHCQSTQTNGRRAALGRRKFRRCRTECNTTTAPILRQKCRETPFRRGTASRRRPCGALASGSAAEFGIPTPTFWSSAATGHASRLLIGIDVTNPNNLFFNYGGTAGVEPAMRLTVGRFVGRDWENRDHSIEASFLGINDYETGQGIRSQTDGGLVLLLDQKQGGINGADVWTTEYSSRFHSIEADLRLRCRPDKDRLVMAPDGTWTRQYTSSYIPSGLLGVRYANLNEDYSFDSRAFGLIRTPAGELTPLTRAEFGADHDIETQNDLIGLQVGGDFINQRERWYWGVRGKAGIFVNFAEQDTIAQFNDLRAPGPDAPGDPSIDIRRASNMPAAPTKRSWARLA